MDTENNIQQTLVSTLDALGMTMEELQTDSRETNVVDARTLLAARLKDCHGTLQADIANMLGLTQAAVSKMLARHRSMLLYNAPYRHKWERIRSRV